MRKSYFLIVGQGIAGTSLAWQLLKRKQKFLVIDNPALPSSSMVAAGIFNPLTGRKLAKTWLADTLFPYAAEFYSQIDNILNIRSLHHTDIFRPYRTPEEKADYLKWTEDRGYEAYLSHKQADHSQDRFVHAPYNGLSVSRSGWVDLPHFLERSRNHFQRLGCFEEAHFSSEGLSFEDDTVTWNGIRFTGIINCMGAGAESDTSFNWLPFNPVKGQILDCLIEEYDKREIVNQGIFILPVSAGKVRVGATYSWHDLDWKNTPEARAYLSEKLSKLLKVPFVIQKQTAGIRPSSRDRRPFVGRHPVLKPMYIFNGLGTKGVTLAPFFARQLVNLLLDEEDLLPEVNIERCFSLYSKPRMS